MQIELHAAFDLQIHLFLVSGKTIQQRCSNIRCDCLHYPDGEHASYGVVRKGYPFCIV